jgi:DNA-binding CsgD family transcriptional regulator
MRRRFDFLLTPREKRLLRRFAQGRTDKSIARELCEPVERIAEQRERLIEKLQIQSTDQLTEIADRLASRGNRQDGPSTGG